jgi:hypothetical protein
MTGAGGRQIMSRGHATFRQSDLERAIRAAKKVGLTDYQIVVDGPRVTVRVGHVEKPKPEAVGSWDDVVAELERQ